MSSNRLRLNSSKIQFIYLGNTPQFAKLVPAAIAADFPTLSFPLLSSTAEYSLDLKLTFAHHIQRVCCDTCYQLRQLRTVARSLQVPPLKLCPRPLYNYSGLSLTATDFL